MLAPRPAGAQQHARVTDELARLLAAADARVYDATLFVRALHDPDPFVRRQAALAAGRIGDSAAVDPVITALGDPAFAVQAAAAFALGLLKQERAVPALATLTGAGHGGHQGPPQLEAVTAIAKIGANGGDDAVAALRGLLVSGAGHESGGLSSIQRAALLQAWRLGARAPVADLLGFAHDPDPRRRLAAIYSLARLRVASAAGTLVEALGDSDGAVRAAALRGVSRVLTDSARLDPHDVATRVGALVTDRDPHVRVNALRALASFRDSGLAPVALPLLTDADVNVAVQAETTLGVLGGSRATAALTERLASTVFAFRRQAAIALAQADSAAGVARAGVLARETDWRWRSVAAEAFGAAKDRAGLEAELADSVGRVVAQALQTLARIVPDSDARAAARARELLQHRDAAVRSVAADLLARHPLVTDVDPLVQAYLRASQDSFNDARLSAVAALAAIAGAGPEGRAAVATGFVARVPRADDYLVRRLAVAKLPDAAAVWGGMAPIVTGRTMDEYRLIVRRLLLPARQGRAAPRVTIETDGGRLVVELLPAEAPLTVAAFLALADRRYFDGSTWHRVVPNFVVQDGDPRGDGWGGPAFVLRDEINPVRYQSGTVGMALSGPDTGGSQYFITLSPQPHLDGTYTVFGRVVAGRDVLDRISQGEHIRSVHR